jgi:L-methionine (R)-S-oxide reductase
MTKSRKRPAAARPAPTAASRGDGAAPRAQNVRASGPDRDPLTYEEIRRLLSTLFREAPGPLEAQESVCEILYDELDHYSWVGIYMVADGELELTAWSGPEATEHTRIKVGEGICGLAAETGETEIVPDVTENERFIACFPSTRSEIVVPILIEREVVGEIDVDSDLLDAFDEQDVRLLEWTAAKLATLV